MPQTSGQLGILPATGRTAGDARRSPREPNPSAAPGVPRGGPGADLHTAAVDEEATRHRCLAWNLGGRRLADLVVDHLQAGAVVYVEGRLQMPPQAETGQRIGQG